MRRALDAELARENITFRQWEVLAWIAWEGDQSQVELAERLNLEAPTPAGILSRMERDGWLERYSCTRDRRKKRIRATRKAETVWSRIVECAETVRAKATQGFSQDELELFRQMCEHIRRNLCGPSSRASLSCEQPTADEVRA